MSPRRRTVLVLLLAAAAGACGGGGGIGDDALGSLRPHLDAVRTAVEDGDRAGASRRLAGLEAEVVRLLAAGDLADDDAIRILGTAADVERDLALLPAPTTTSPAPPPPVAGDEDEEGGRPGRGKGKDKSGEDDDHD